MKVVEVVYRRAAALVRLGHVLLSKPLVLFLGSLPDLLSGVLFVTQFADLSKGEVARLGRRARRVSRMFFGLERAFFRVNLMRLLEIA